MSQIPPLRDIVNLTPADATDVEFNFNLIEQNLRSEVINRDGSVAMVAPLLLSGPPTQDNHAANKAYVDDLIPPGTLIDYASSTLPADFEGVWESCEGQSVSTTDPKYVRLFAVIGYQWGGAGGSFNLPDYREKVNVGRNPASAAYSVGDYGGAANGVGAHTHTGPNHNHSGPSHNHSINHDHPSVTTSADTHSHGDTFAVNNGGNHRHWSGPNDDHQILGNVAAIDDPLTSVGAPNVDLSGWRTGRFLTEYDGVHTHGLAGGIQSDQHSHSVNLPNFGGTSGNGGTGNTGNSGTGNTGSSGTAAGNYPPYAVATKLIRL